MGEGFDSHWGKYDSPLAALTERWILDGERGDHEYSNPDWGEGTILLDAPTILTWDDALYLRDEYGCNDEELTLLSKELGMAQGVAHGWDSQGFIYGSTFDTVSEYREAIERLEALNDQMDGEVE